MATVTDVVTYLHQNYPDTEELTQPRLTQLIYLADWRSSIKRQQQITDIDWVFDNFGPYAEVSELCRSENVTPKLSPEERDILDFVIESTRDKYWIDFTRLVYSTYPIVTQARHEKLNLVKLAGDYLGSRTGNMLTQ